MKKRFSITIAVVVSLFIGVNAFLLFSKDSKIQKSVYVPKYERVTEGDFKETLPKQGLIAPREVYTVYVGNEDAIDTWLVKEGGQVQAGGEIATLRAGSKEDQIRAWEAEQEGLLRQQITVESTLSSLQAERMGAGGNGSTIDATAGDTDININVEVTGMSDGAYAQAIADTERELAEIERKLAVLEMQLSNPEAGALFSPADGVVSAINRHGAVVSADLFSEDKEIVTYVDLKEWQKIEPGDEAVIQKDSLGGTLSGTVVSVAEVPAPQSEWTDAYEALDPGRSKNPLERYEVRLAAEEGMPEIPYGANVNTVVTVNEAENALSVKRHWLTGLRDEQASVWVIDEDGRAAKADLSVPFVYQGRAIVTDGLSIGDVAFDSGRRGPLAELRESAPVFLPMPLEAPSKEAWKSFGWKDYVRHMFIR